LTDDHAGQGYWDGLWESIPPRYPPRKRSDLDHVEQQFAATFEAILAGKSVPRVLEVGCARSIWLPYLARVCDAVVSGIDYSSIGCDQARALLEQAGVRGEVIRADALDPPADLLRAFDLVYSFGVVEHFGDTENVIAGLARYLRPGGTLMTVVPNMRGAIGLVERVVNPRVWAIHERLSPEDLALASRRAGLLDVRARYFVGVNFGILNLVGLEDSLKTRAKALLLRGLTRITIMTWRLERVFTIPPTRALAGYVVCTAVAPDPTPPRARHE
jgi:SAM-dependent methyltransferase